MGLNNFLSVIKGYMDGLTVITFEGTSNSAPYDMTVDIPEGRTIILKTARVEINYADDTYPRSISIQIDNTCSTTHVVDSDPSRNFFKVMLDQNLYNVTTPLALKRNISITYPDCGYKVSGRINKNCFVNIYAQDGQPLPGLVYFFFQFQVL